MPKMTLLDIVQDIMSDMESDDVNSIDDTVESLEVAQIVKSTYFSLIDGKDWPHLYQLFQLTASGDTDFPTHMTLPERVSDLTWVKYNCRTLTDTKDSVRKIYYKNPEDFMSLLDARSSSDSFIQVVSDPSGVKLNIYNDRAPT